jgi:hypothetical protein
MLCSLWFQVVYPEVSVYGVLSEEKPNELTQTLCVEDYLEGSFRKYVDNKGDILIEGDNTVEAFIHFSYEESSQLEMVLDIQKIGNSYTDPLIATKSGSLGEGDFGVLAMRNFLEKHRCNGICYAFLARSALSKKKLPIAKGAVPASLIGMIIKCQ